MGLKNSKFKVGDTVIFNNLSRMENGYLIEQIFGEDTFSCIHQVEKIDRDYVSLMNKDGIFSGVPNSYLDLKPLAEYKTFLQFKFSISNKEKISLLKETNPELFKRELLHEVILDK